MIRFPSVLLVLCLVASGAMAAPAHGHYGNSAAGRRLINRLYANQGIPKATTRRLLNAARYQPDIIARMKNPAEKTLTWAQYRQIFVRAKRARQGAQYIASHRALFARAEAKYGVPAYIIAAILGVETRYGRFVGHHRVLDALSTLAFDYPKRSKFFTRQLAEFLTLCVSEKLDCTRARGSYAGAMGVTQFMPTSYAAYAVDGNGDGKRDLWHEPADIIDSVANYLAAHGWRRGGGIAQPARLSRTPKKAGIRPSTDAPRYRWRQLGAKGVAVARAPAPTARVGLLALTGPHGREYWLAQHNFFVITRYNSSPLYAMAVYQLGREIKAERPPQAVRP